MKNIHFAIVLVCCQFLGTTTWFSANAIVPELSYLLQTNTAELIKRVTLCLQLGFILGSLVFSIFQIADRFNAQKVFGISVFSAAIFNLLIIKPNLHLYELLFFRFMTGFCLAGVYPVGMKIASMYFKEKAGLVLSFLVASLVFGSAFPHLLNSLAWNIPWKLTIITSSILAITSALLIKIIPTVKAVIQNRICLRVLPNLLKNPSYRNYTFAYMGHMWELYTFWAFIPLLLQQYNLSNNTHIPVSLLSFLTMAAGSLGCIWAGLQSKKTNKTKIVKIALFISCLCCFISIISFQLNPIVLVFLLFIWGFFVVADSPLLSDLIANSIDLKQMGTALTFSTFLGFTTTLISLYAIGHLLKIGTTTQVLCILGIGPCLGYVFLTKKQ